MANTIETLKASKQAAIDALNAKNTQLMNTYDSQAKALPGQYQPYRNAAYVDSAARQRAIQERAANLGKSAEGQGFLSQQQNSYNGLMSQIGEYNRQQQSALDALNLNKTNAGIQLASDIATTGAGYDTQIAQAQQAEDELNLQTQLSLLSRGLINAKQFKDRTGIDLARDLVPRSGKSAPKAKRSAKDDYYDLRAAGADDETAQYLSGHKPVTQLPNDAAIRMGLTNR